MLIWQVTLIIENLLPDIYLLFQWNYIMAVEVAEVCVVVSTTHVEYIAATEVEKEIWLKRFLQQLGLH